jgi:dTDP-4-dehydrorhamnose reductase
MRIQKILVTGANGQLGWALSQAAKVTPNFEYIFLDRHAMDLSIPSELERIVELFAPSAIINAAAYTAVDKAESTQKNAFAINERAVAEIARYCQKNNKRFLHFSTDYVFDGTKAGAYPEFDQTNPLSVYGRSKLEGERALAQACPHHLIFRTSWVVGAHGGNFLKTMLKFAQEREALRIVSDQQGAPTSANLLAQTTADILRVMAGQPATDPRWGVYNLVAAGQTNWHAYASYVIAQARTLGWPIKIKDDAITPILTAEYPVAATRPLNSVLDTSKIRQTFGVNLPDWRVGVDEVLQTLSRLR